MTKNPRGFASDNYAGIHPTVLQAIAEANVGHEVAYGEDSVTAKFDGLVRELFGPNAVGYPVFNGTGANVVALQAATKRWEAVICVESAHIHVDEGGAPEKMAGLKLWTVPTSDGKLTVELAASQIFDMGVVHRAQPGVISITQTTEMGTLYQVDEIRALADLAHEHGLLLHLDGARISNAAAALGKSFKEFTTDAGVDLVSLGGTKIGALAAEAVIVTDASSIRGKALAEAMPFLRKTSMQLSSKMRFMSAQLLALFENNAAVAIENATRANAMAKMLYEGVVEIAADNPLVSVENPAEANAVFPVLPAAVTEKLQQQYRFYVWNQETGQVRWMCSWDTTEEDVAGILAALKAAL
ncbi:threonine aldolase family protein [Candidatus Rhodoluna planktonica]|uniref:Threonine aldolase n=1 Tax=Candidatus Rhodoluna planktonica TaxID=535712 RepID=A0A1D9DXX8_9MICO|nr:beta-eliminating lyase-related protein [Candidatus Rhodoluna planktonica]AOY55664.1 threonine aldolase [Candidatus Rhodoluna planktonica]